MGLSLTALSDLLGLYILILLGAAVPCILVVFFLQKFCSPISQIPGPYYTSFGTIWQCWRIWKGDYPVAVLELHRRYGPLVRISYNEVSIGDTEGLRILNSNMDKGPLYDCFAIPNGNYQNTMSERRYHETMRMRQNAAAGYTLTNVLRSEPYLDELISLMEQRIDEDGSGGAKSIELGKWIHFLTMDVVGELTFSTPFGFLREARDIGNSVWNTARASFYISFCGSCQWLHYLALGSPILRFIDVEKIPFIHMWTTVLNGVAKRKANLEARFDMMEHWMTQSRKQPDQMPEAELLTAALANLGAGGDTPGSAIQAIFYYLLKNNPRYLNNIREELSKAGHVPAERSPMSFADSQKLVYLQACIKETLRLYSPVPWTLPRVVSAQGIRVGETHFAPGTVLSVSPYVIHHNKDIWGPDADEFRPERWLEASKPSKEMERHFIPFGAGYNRCLGHNLAACELGKVAGTLLRDFDFRLEYPDKDWTLRYVFVTNPHGWPVFATRRPGKALA